MNIKAKTIFIYVNQGFSVRYLLRSSILKSLSNNSHSNRIVILSHNGNEKVFIDAFASANVVVEKFKNEKYDEYLKNNRIQRIIKEFRAYVLNGKFDTRF